MVIDSKKPSMTQNRCYLLGGLSVGTLKETK